MEIQPDEEKMTMTIELLESRKSSLSLRERHRQSTPLLDLLTRSLLKNLSVNHMITSESMEIYLRKEELNSAVKTMMDPPISETKLPPKKRRSSAESVTDNLYKSANDSSERDTELLAGNEGKDGKPESDKTTLLRKRNAVYSKRKYYKKKREVQRLETTRYDLESSNMGLRLENERLTALLHDARKKVAFQESFESALKNPSVSGGGNRIDYFNNMTSQREQDFFGMYSNRNAGRVLPYAGADAGASFLPPGMAQLPPLAGATTQSQIHVPRMGAGLLPGNGEQNESMMALLRLQQQNQQRQQADDAYMRYLMMKRTNNWGPPKMP